MREFVTKHSKKLTLMGIILCFVCIIIILFLSNYKENTNKELQKRFIFCEGKSGKVEYDFVCSSTGECQKQYLHCDYLNYLQQNKIVDLQTIDYKKMNEEYKLRFDNASSTTK